MILINGAEKITPSFDEKTQGWVLPEAQWREIHIPVNAKSVVLFCTGEAHIKLSHQGLLKADGIIKHLKEFYNHPDCDYLEIPITDEPHKTTYIRLQIKTAVEYSVYARI